MNTCIRKLLFACFVLVSSDLFAQTATIDSLLKNISHQKKDTAEVSALNALAVEKASLAFELAEQNSDSALLLAKEALAYSIEKKFAEGAANAFNSLGWIYLHKGAYDKAVQYLLKAKDAFDKIDFHYDLAKVNMNLAEVYIRQSNISSAIKCLLEAESLTLTQKMPSLLYDIKRQMGIIYREAGDKPKSVLYLKEALAGFIQLKDTARYINTSISLSILFKTMSLPDSGLAYMNTCLKMARSIPDNDYQIAMVEEHLGDNYLTLENYDKSLQHFTQAYLIFEKINHRADLSYESLNIGRTLVKLKEYAKAEKYFLNAYKINDSLNLINYQQEVLQALAGLHQARNNWKKAYQYLQESITVEDSLNHTANIAQTAELKEKYETEKKEQEIVLLKKDKEVALLTMQRQKAIQYGVVLLLALVTLIAILIINRMRVLQQAKRLIEIEKMRNAIARDLHDDIGSTLTSMNILSKVMLQQPQNEANFTSNVQKLNEHATIIMESMSDIVWAINPNNDSVEKLIFRMKEFAAEILEPLNINYIFKQKGDFSALQLDPKQRKDFFLIFKEAINNIAKYSQGSNVEIYLENEKKKIHLSITDNGRGFEERQSTKGNGLRNMRERAKALKGTIQWDTAIGKGTSLSLQIPIA